MGWPSTTTLWAFARYLLSGCASFAVDFSIYGTLTGPLHLHPNLAQLVSRPLGGVTCFLLNRHFTFRAAGRGSAQLQFATFWCVFFISLGLTEALIALFCGGMGLSPMTGKAIAEAVAVVFNFLALKHWTFR